MYCTKSNVWYWASGWRWLHCAQSFKSALLRARFQGSATDSSGRLWAHALLLRCWKTKRRQRWKNSVAAPLSKLSIHTKAQEHAFIGCKSALSGRDGTPYVLQHRRLDLEYRLISVMRPALLTASMLPQVDALALFKTHASC
jgi:hypothetical protein